MALIKCPECQHDVSESAQSCPNCGFEVKTYLDFQKREEDKKRQEEQHQLEKLKEGCGCLFLIVLIIFAIIGLYSCFNTNNVEKIYITKCDWCGNEEECRKYYVQYEEVDKYYYFCDSCYPNAKEKIEEKGSTGITQVN